MVRKKHIGVWAMMVVLSSCTTLPRSGPTHQAIDSQASEKLVSADKKSGVSYALVDITKNVVGHYEYSIISSLEAGFGVGRSAPPEVQLGVGDVVEISIFEAQAGGLFIPDDAGSRPGNYITLPKQTVDRAGMITVPYAGSVEAAGRPVSAVQADIEKRLANRAIEPQVVITTTLSRSQMVSILGDVNSPAQLDLNPAGERVLEVISRAGGINAPGYETYVTIERRGKKATVLFRTLIDKPSENIYVRPGDVVYVNRERRTYLAFGASGLNGRIDFEDSNLTLGEAVAKAGGLLDDRADPSQVFLYREVDRKTLQETGVDVSRFSGDLIPTVFRANLRDPGTFFAVQQFKMKDKDIIYVSNSNATEISKFLSFVNGVSNTTANVPANALTTRNSIRRLTN
ncbi:polysaccharide biosynthesis/export family protein [Rhizobium sp. FKL33]|uniref:polysaccharide biosynthesis/export family protein n=1 Tax=Rhizobium sp. FKL33 TaxID=2562307 RepID=UPI001FF00E7A|nr:polysaccharide biosynthesis/export family protein [Rhizobium sp. FKL33]